MRQLIFGEPMKKSILYAGLLGAALLFSGCGEKKEVVDTQVVTVESGSVAEAVSVGEKIRPLKLDDQFEKSRELTEELQKVIFIFSRDTGDMVHAYLAEQSEGYLKERNTAVVADISRMPSLITKYVAMPGFQEYKYSMMLILDEETGKPYKNEKEKEKAMIVSLENLTVTGVTFVATAADLKAAID
jgi:hypothetical protein